MITVAITLTFAVVGGALALWLWCCLQLSLGLIEGRKRAWREWWRRR